MSGQWVKVPDGSIVYVVPLYPSSGGPDDLTDGLDHWATTHAQSSTVIDVDANPAIIRGEE